MLQIFLVRLSLGVVIMNTRHSWLLYVSPLHAYLVFVVIYLELLKSKWLPATMQCNTALCSVLALATILLVSCWSVTTLGVLMEPTHFKQANHDSADQPNGCCIAAAAVYLKTSVTLA